MSGREPSPDAMASFATWAALAESCQLLSNNAGTLARIIVVPILLSMSIIFIAPLVSPLWQDVLMTLLFLLGWILFSVSWLRLLLLDDRSIRRFFPRLERRHLRVAGYALLLILIDLPLVFTWHFLDEEPQAAQTTEVLYWLAYIFLGFIKLRFAFVYPAAAIDERYSLKLAWQHSHSASLPLLTAFLIAIVAPFAGLSYGLSELMDKEQWAYISWALWHVSVWMIEAIYLAIIAIAFRCCAGWVPPPNKAILERFE